MRAPVGNRGAAGVALVIWSACFFGSLGVFGKLAYRLGLSTPQLLSYRFGLAALLLWLAAAVMGQHLPPRRSLIGLAIMEHHLLRFRILRRPVELHAGLFRGVGCQ